MTRDTLSAILGERPLEKKAELGRYSNHVHWNHESMDRFYGGELMLDRWVVRLALAILLTAVACSDASTQVDRGLVGTWELMVSNPEDVARWVWDVHADQLTQANTMRATGILGTASWSRVKPGDTRSRDILAYLTTRPLLAGMLEAPFGDPRTESAAVDAQARNDGVIGIVQTDVQSPNGAGSISVRIYRDWTSAHTAYAMDALYDSQTFRVKRDEVVYSQTYSRVRSQGKCLSRTWSNVATATVSCYLLVEDPAREAVIIVSEFSEKRAGASTEASDEAYEHAASLLTAGIRYWELNLVAMKAKGISP